MTHPYPALPRTKRQRHPEQYRPLTWLEAFEHGCPRCGCDSYTMWSPMYGLHDIQIEAGWAPGLEDDDLEVHKVIAFYTTFTDMEEGDVHCDSCHHVLTLDQTEIDYA